MRELELTTYEAYNDLAETLQCEQDKIKTIQADAKRYAAQKLISTVRNAPDYDDDECIFEME